MVLGLIAVFSAIVYKLSDAGEGSASRLSSNVPVEAGIAIPDGYRLSATALDGDRALLTLVAPDGSTELVLVDLGSGATLGRYPIEAGQ